MQPDDYTRIVLPTPDTFLCRGTNVFASPPTLKSKHKVLVAIPTSYVDIITNRAYSDVLGYHPDLEDIFVKSGRDFLRYVLKHGMTYESVASLETGVDVCFVDCKETNLVNIIDSVEHHFRKLGGKKTIDVRHERSRLEVQAVLDEPRAELQLNGYNHTTPRYGDMGPDISDRFMVEVDNLKDPDQFEALSKAVKIDTFKAEDADEYDPPDVYRHIPVDRYQAIMKHTPEPNQFLVLTEFKEEGEDVEERAFCLNYETRRFEQIDFDDIDRRISPIWVPRSPFHIRQKCSLYALLEERIKIVYLVGGKQTGKTSTAMAAAEARQFGKVFSKNFRKPGEESVEEHITLIKSGLAKGVWTEQDLLYAYASFRRAFSEQKLGGYPFEEMLKPRISRSEERLPTKGDPRNIMDKLYLPDVAPFVLLHPNEEQGMSFTGVTIRDESQNEYPHKMKEFFSRRGPGAKIVVLGDLYGQIFRPGLDQYWNGLLLSIFKNYGQPHVAGVKLTDCWAAR